MSHLSVPRTLKLAIGGAYPRSESGRVYPVTDASGGFLANAAKASRKDARDAVVAARAALSGWSNAAPMLRGQVLYRVAELLEGRRAQFAHEVATATGVTAAEASREVDDAIDTWVWYAGWCDKYQQVAGSGNPVAGPYFNLSVPEPVGVVAMVAPQDSVLLGLVRASASALVAGNTLVVVANESAPSSAVSLAEVLGASDVPGGVVNILTGSPAELGPWLAGHADVDALDLLGAESLDWATLEATAADTIKRVLRPESGPRAAAPSCSASSRSPKPKPSGIPKAPASVVSSDTA